MGNREYEMEIRHILQKNTVKDTNKMSAKDPDVLFVRVNEDGVVLSRHKGGKKVKLVDVLKMKDY